MTYFVNWWSSLPLETREEALEAPPPPRAPPAPVTGEGVVLIKNKNNSDFIYSNIYECYPMHQCYHCHLIDIDVTWTGDNDDLPEDIRLIFFPYFLFPFLFSFLNLQMHRSLHCAGIHNYRCTCTLSPSLQFILCILSLSLSL